MRRTVSHDPATGQDTAWFGYANTTGSAAEHGQDATFTATVIDSSSPTQQAASATLSITVH